MKTPVRPSKENLDNYLKQLHNPDGIKSLHKFLTMGGYQFVDLSGADLHGANLSEANLSGADLHGANLSEANLSGANLSGANLSKADLSGANLQKEAFLYEANLSEANLSGATLHGAILRRADLSGADLSGAFLHGANLYEANLSGAFLHKAFLHGANLEGAILKGAILISRAGLRGEDWLNWQSISRDVYTGIVTEINTKNGNFTPEQLAEAITTPKALVEAIKTGKIPAEHGLRATLAFSQLAKSETDQRTKNAYIDVVKKSMEQLQNLPEGQKPAAFKILSLLPKIIESNKDNVIGFVPKEVMHYIGRLLIAVGKKQGVSLESTISDLRQVNEAIGISKQLTASPDNGPKRAEPAEHHKVEAEKKPDKKHADKHKKPEKPEKKTSVAQKARQKFDKWVDKDKNKKDNKGQGRT